MPRIPAIDLYLDPADGDRLLDWLNAQEEVAFIRTERATPHLLSAGLPKLTQGKHFLFHKSYASIPIHAPLSEEEKAVSSDVHSLMELDPPEPLSGPNESHPAIFTLRVQYVQRVGWRRAIGLSHISWIGNRYAGLGREATPASMRWWRRLNAWIRRNAKKVSRSGPLDEFTKGLCVWAFPSALASIEAGAKRAENPSVF